ncbi:MAG: hemerythrin domain-containing protein [Bradymonadaceae bacterium]
MEITDAIRGEHAVYYAWLDEFEELAGAESPDVAVPRFAALFQSALAGHAMLEDKLLFDRLASIDAAREPLEAVREDHHRLNDALTELRECDPGREGRERAGDIVDLAREHFRREEERIFPLAEEELRGEVLREAGAEWADRRDVHLGDP